MKFSKNNSITIGSRKYIVKDMLGEGGQGEVYLVENEDKHYAFKYYKYTPSSDFIYNLKNNVKLGSPADTFLWPLETAEFDDGTFGYLMKLRDKNYLSFVSYLTGKNQFESLGTKINWCIELVKSFKLLHEKGFSYQDLNDGSFFFEPNTGKLLICDNDNVSANKTNLGILGKMRYMAPEIVRGDKDRLTGEEQMPDVHSDRFSLAVILFLTFCLGNPFEGECLKNYPIIDEKAEYEMFGSKPVYIYDENNKSNRPIRGYHTCVLKYYPMLPSYIKDAFHKTFTEGLKDRENARTTEIEWLKLLCRYRDELISCKCGKQYIYGFNERKQNERCPHCGVQTHRFCYLNINRSRVLLEPGKFIYMSHIDKYSGEYNQKVGVVIQNKNNPSLWGIKLKLNSDVLIKDTAGTEKVIAKDGVIPIVNNLKIKFQDNSIGQIVCNK